MRMGFWAVAGAVCLLAGCGNAPAGGSTEEAASIQLNLSTTALSGTEYRLGPATFLVTGQRPDQQWVLTATGSEPTLHLALEPGFYHVSLQSDWSLARVAGETLTPVAATLLDSSERDVRVDQFATTPVNYAFHLGESGIDIGLSVDEGIPEGYDGRLMPGSSPGYYYIELRNGGGACCVQSLAEAEGWYPGLRLLPPQT